MNCSREFLKVLYKKICNLLETMSEIFEYCKSLKVFNEASLSDWICVENLVTEAKINSVLKGKTINSNSQEPPVFIYNLVFSK